MILDEPPMVAETQAGCTEMSNKSKAFDKNNVSSFWEDRKFIKQTCLLSSSEFV